MAVFLWEIEMDKQLSAEAWLALARESFLLIRNLSNYRRGSLPSEETIHSNLLLIGDLSDALHNLPVNLNIDNSFNEKLVKTKLRELIQQYPQFKDYFKYIL